MGKKLGIPQSVFHRVEDPKHPGQYLYPGVFFIGTKKDATYYIRYRDKEGKARFEKAGPTAHTAALAADVRRDRIRGREEPNTVRKAVQEAEKKISTTFQDYSDTWLERKKPTLAHSTYRNYASMLKVHVNPNIGKIPIVQVTYKHIDDMLARMDGQSGTRKNTALIMLGGIFKDAVLRGDIEANPTARVKRFREEKPEIDPMSFGEVKQCLAHIPKHYQVYFTTAFLTGARPGELFALRKMHIDFKLRTIAIREGMVDGKIGKLKTVSSKRDIDILPPLLPILKPHVDSLPADPTTLIFTTPSGTPMDLTNLRNLVWYPTLKRAGLRRRTMYQARHTYASLMLSAGEDPQWVSRMLGHADLSVLISHYAKYIRDRERMDGRKFVQGFDEAGTPQKILHQ